MKVHDPNHPNTMIHFHKFMIHWKYSPPHDFSVNLRWIFSNVCFFKFRDLLFRFENQSGKHLCMTRTKIFQKLSDEIIIHKVY